MIEQVITALKECVDRIRVSTIRRTDQQNAALLAILAAVQETKVYIRDFTHRPRNPDKEAELSRLWIKAALPVRHVDIDLADRCLLKAEYWLHPDEWTGARIRQFRLGLDNIHEYCKQLLRE